MNLSTVIISCLFGLFMYGLGRLVVWFVDGLFGDRPDPGLDRLFCFGLAILGVLITPFAQQYASKDQPIPGDELQALAQSESPCVLSYLQEYSAIITPNVLSDAHQTCENLTVVLEQKELLK